MANYKAKSAMTVVETYEAAIDEAVKTFTFTNDDMDDTAMYVLVLDGSIDGALRMSIGFNGVVSAYFTEGQTTIGGTTTVIDLGTESSCALFLTTQGAGVEDNFHIVIEIMLVKGSSADYIHAFSRGNVNGTDVRMSLRSVNDATSINSIELTTSANKWQAGSRFTLYKVKRTA